MPNVICFGRELPDIEFEYLAGLGKCGLFVLGDFVGYFPVTMEPLQAYCDYLAHGRFERAEFLALRNMRIEDPEMVLAHHFGAL
jgi:hypothetical protein